MLSRAYSKGFFSCYSYLCDSSMVLVEWKKMGSHICNSPPYQIVKKNILTLWDLAVTMFLTSATQKGQFFLTRVRFGLSHFRKHKFMHSFLDIPNPICICCFDIETLNYFFLHCPRFTNERQNIWLKIESIIIDIIMQRH